VSSRAAGELEGGQKITTEQRETLAKQNLPALPVIQEAVKIIQRDPRTYL